MFAINQVPNGFRINEKGQRLHHSRQVGPDETKSIFSSISSTSIPVIAFRYQLNRMEVVLRASAVSTVPVPDDPSRAMHDVEHGPGIYQYSFQTAAQVKTLLSLRQQPS